MSVYWIFLFFHILSGASEKGKSLLAHMESEDEASFQLFLQEVMVKTLVPYKCVVLVTDDLYKIYFEKMWFKRFGPFITFIVINVDSSQDLLSPYPETQSALVTAKNEGCQMYIILISNGLQVERLLRFGDRYRVIDTRAKFVVLYDNRLFTKHLFYIWRRIINVIFIKEYGGQKSGDFKKKIPWLEITTVPFPSQIVSILVPRRLDIWSKARFQKGVDLFRDKTSDLKNQTLKIVAFGHIPGTVKNLLLSNQTVRAVVGNYSGAEVEILQTVSSAMNFRCEIYEPHNAEKELWGGKAATGGYTGLIGEMANFQADIALGDLYYIPGLMWTAVLICLLLCGAVFYTLARFHEYNNALIKQQHAIRVPIKKTQIITVSMCSKLEKIDSDAKYTLLKSQFVEPTVEGQPIGLYQFSEPFNSVLYTYSMLLLVSLPKLPTGWSLRMLTGWYWLYCLLLVVAYRASMTAILASPIPRVTIDTLQQLIDSKLTCGGWGEINRDFFKHTLDPTTRQIGSNFELVNDSSKAVDRVAQGTFAFYENSYFLKEALVKRQLRFQTSRSNQTANNSQESKDIVREDRTLHIMSDCVIKMPISIGLQKNSPIKPRVDKFIRRVLEAGLIKKWLDDVMSPILNAEVLDVVEANKAIMNMKKFVGAVVALFIGYFISFVALGVEILYFQFVVKKNPNYNKYTRSVQNIKKVN